MDWARAIWKVIRWHGILLKRALWAANEDGCFSIAKAAAYSALTAFFPVLTTLITTLILANAEWVSKLVAEFLFEVVPPGAKELVQFNVERGAKPTSLLVLAVLTSAWAGSGVIMSLLDGFQAAYRIPTGRHFVKERLVAILLLFLALAPLLGASALIVFGDATERNVIRTLGFLPEGDQLKGWVALIGRVARTLVAMATIAAVTALLYRIGPTRSQTWGKVWPGALLTTLLWYAVTAAFAWYLRNLGEYNVMYGGVAGVMAMLVWMYLLALITLIGCEYNAERERLLKWVSA